MSSVSEAKIDQLEEQLKKRIEVLSGFADDEVMARKLETTFKHFDTDRSGKVDFDEFTAAMTRLNFIGCQHEVEALFDRFDEDSSGSVGYLEFAESVFGLNKANVSDPNSRSVVERVKALIIARGGANGIRTLTAILRRMDKDGSFSLDRGEINQGMLVYGVELDDTEGGDLDKIMKYFDRDGSGKVSVEEFMRGVRGTMHKRRIKLVKQAFSLLDYTGDGVCTIEDFQAAYDTSEHPQVKAGNMSADEALLEFMEVFETGKADGIIAWSEFLDYYKDLSAGIDNDDYFELMIRNAWHMSGGEGWCGNTTCRRVMVTHSDGSQEVLEIENDLGLRADDIEGMKDRLRSQGVQDIQGISLAD